MCATYKKKIYISLWLPVEQFKPITIKYAN